MQNIPINQTHQEQYMILSYRKSNEEKRVETIVLATRFFFFFFFFL